jgi:heme o synthase
MLNTLASLLRFKLSLAVAFSALAGFIYFSHTISWNALFAFSGVFLFAAAASALNQYQERRFDVLMERTRNRPLPSNLLTGRQALFAAALSGLAGLTLLFCKTTPFAAGIAVINLAWYNCVYTPLKRKGGFAVLLGAVSGALPPMIGLTAAGGQVNGAGIAICLFMYLWQISHFLLLLLKYGREYEIAGFPSITALMDENRLRSMIFIWILGTAASLLLFPLFRVVSSAGLMTALIIGSCLLVFYFHTALFRKKTRIDSGAAFRVMYFFQVFVLVALVAEGVLRKV